MFTEDIRVVSILGREHKSHQTASLRPETGQIAFVAARLEWQTLPNRQTIQASGEDITRK